MSLVLDASITVTWFFEDEPTYDGLLDRVIETRAHVPSVWRLEVANALQMGIRRGRIDRDYRSRVLAKLRSLPIALDLETDRMAWTETLGLSDRFGLTVYDAAYLELARRLRLPLATLDAALVAAAKAAEVEVLPA